MLFVVIQCLPSSVEDRLADALVACFTDTFRGLADLKKTTLRTNAAAAATAGNPGLPPSSVSILSFPPFYWRF